MSSGTPQGDAARVSIRLGADTQARGHLTPFAGIRGPGKLLSGYIFDSLTAPDVTGGQKPWLAKSWETSPDGLTWTFRLQENARFTDARRSPPRTALHLRVRPHRSGRRRLHRQAHRDRHRRRPGHRGRGERGAVLQHQRGYPYDQKAFRQGVVYPSTERHAAAARGRTRRSRPAGALGPANLNKNVPAYNFDQRAVVHDGRGQAAPACGPDADDLAEDLPQSSLYVPD